MSAPKFESFEEFWPYYVLEHSNKVNRRLHFAGTGAALGVTVYALMSGRYRALMATPLVGYGAAWVGHFLVEKNKPATFDYPLWSLRGDLRMFTMMLAGTMDDEVLRCAQEAAEAATERTAARKSNGQSSHRRKLDPGEMPAVNAAPLN